MRKAVLSNNLSKQPLWLLLQGFNMIVVASFSFAFHASQTKFGVTLDHAGINLATAYWVLYGVYDLFEEDIGDVLRDYPLLALGTGMFENFADVMSGAAAIVSFFAVYIWVFLLGGAQISSVIVMGVALVLGELAIDWQQNREQAVLHREYEINRRFTILQQALILPAGIAFTESMNMDNCDPDAWFQWSAVWHILGAGFSLSQVLLDYSEVGYNLASEQVIPAFEGEVGFSAYTYLGSLLTVAAVTGITSLKFIN